MPHSSLGQFPNVFKDYFIRLIFFYINGRLIKFHQIIGFNNNSYCFNFCIYIIAFTYNRIN